MRCHGPSTASSARRRQTATNSKWRVATAWNCWLPKHHPRGNTTGAGSILRPWCFLAGRGDIVGTVLNCAIVRTDFPANECTEWGFSRCRIACLKGVELRPADGQVLALPL